MNTRGGRCEPCWWGKHHTCARGVSDLGRVCACDCGMWPGADQVLLAMAAGALELRHSADPEHRRIAKKFTDYLLDELNAKKRP
jgi:hypothetical protein